MSAPVATLRRISTTGAIGEIVVGAVVLFYGIALFRHRNDYVNSWFRATPDQHRIARLGLFVGFVMLALFGFLALVGGLVNLVR